jgi:L-ascorbate metabolism protein UlaG (beta-lactamase superfamily)
MKKSNIIYLLIITGFIFQSCMTIKHSSLRVQNPGSIIIKNCKISNTGAVYLNIFGLIKLDFMPASIKIEIDDGPILFIDPVVVNDNVKADYIFITHDHFDHFSKIDIEKLIKPETILIGPKTVTNQCADYNTKVALIGDKISLDKIDYEVVESYNINSNRHKKGSNFVGYVITHKSTRIYIAGDTDFIPEMLDLENITVAIIPIGERKTAMNPHTAAKAVNNINPDIAIPIHYELEQNREKEFFELVNKNIEVRFFK